MLAPNARIAVVAPAGIPRVEGLELGMALVRSWGYVPVASPNLRAKHRYNAGRPEERASDLIWALTAPDISAVWFARGGFGSIHVIPKLDGLELDRRPVIGCSDATAVLSALAKTRGGHLIHGPMLETIATPKVDDETRNRTRELLAGRAGVEIAGRQILGPEREVRAPVAGGNLAMMASIAGTPWQMQLRGTIAVIEDIGEAAYRIDRMFAQLRHSGSLAGVAAIAFGDFVDCTTPKDADYSLEDVLRELVADLEIPVVSGLPVGHGPRNLPWRFGVEGVLSGGVLRQ